MKEAAEQGYTNTGKTCFRKWNSFWLWNSYIWMLVPGFLWSCGFLCVWNTATWKIYLQVLCLYGQIIFYNYLYSFKEKNPRSTSDDNTVYPLSHNASSPSLKADIEGRWAEAAPATAGSSAHSHGWSIDAWMDTFPLQNTIPSHCSACASLPSCTLLCFL